MVFKLVRIDTQEPSKIQLLIGTHVIGRGKFLHDDDTDKRVSRNHAELEVTGDTVTLKSLHHNPCFYIKKSTDETQLLQQNCIISLCHGDKFGLIPDHFWYEVLHCSNQENMDLGNRIHESAKNGVESRDEGIEESDNNQIVEETEELSEQNDAASETSGAEEDGGAIEFEDIEEAPGSNRSASPVLMPADQECTEDYEVPPQVPSDIKTEKSPAKRSHSSRESSPVDAKKVKTEPNAGDVMAGPSNQPNNQQASSDLDSKVKTDASGSPVKPPLRERCIYGSNCYRRNPQHKAQFSHPSDGDWGGGARGACPYGRACRRHDPRHWDAHDHPPGVVQPLDPNGPRPGMRVVQRHGNVFYINAHAVNFYDDYFQVEDSDGDSVDYDYEF